MDLKIVFVLVSSLLITTSDCAVFIPSPHGLSYYVLPNSYSFGDGLQKCEQLNSSLILPPSAEVQDFLLHLYPRVFSKSRVWVDAIGVPFRKVFEPTGNAPSSDYQPWASGFPKICKTSCCAAALSASGNWKGRDCSRSYRVICQREFRSNAVKFITSSYGKEYYHNLTAVSQDEAVRSCKTLNADLVSIETPTEQTFVSNFVSSNYFWTSGKYSRNNGWQWLSGNPFVYSNPFTRGNGRCTSAESCCIYVLTEQYEWKWHQHDCSTPIGFICERPVAANDEYGAFIRQTLLDLDQRIRDHEESHMPVKLNSSQTENNELVSNGSTTDEIAYPSNLEQRIEKLDNLSLTTAEEVFGLTTILKSVNRELTSKIGHVASDLKKATESRLAKIESRLLQSDGSVFVAENDDNYSIGSWVGWPLILLVVILLLVAIGGGWLCSRRMKYSLREPSTTLDANINKSRNVNLSSVKTGDLLG